MNLFSISCDTSFLKKWRLRNHENSEGPNFCVKNRGFISGKIVSYEHDKNVICSWACRKRLKSNKSEANLHTYSNIGLRTAFEGRHTLQEACWYYQLLFHPKRKSFFFLQRNFDLFCVFEESTSLLREFLALYWVWNVSECVTHKPEIYSYRVNVFQLIKLKG